MIYEHVLATNTAGVRIRHFIADTLAEIEPIAGQQKDTAYCLENNTGYRFVSGVWTSEVNSQKVSVSTAGLNVNAAGNFTGDIVAAAQKGLILYAPNGHRMRLVVTNLGTVAGVDLDA